MRINVCETVIVLNGVVMMRLAERRNVKVFENKCLKCMVGVACIYKIKRSWYTLKGWVSGAMSKGWFQTRMADMERVDPKFIRMTCVTEELQHISALRECMRITNAVESDIEGIKCC